jgi:hypothetical protein
LPSTTWRIAQLMSFSEIDDFNAFLRKRVRNLAGGLKIPAAPPSASASSTTASFHSGTSDSALTSPSATPQSPDTSIFFTGPR